MDLSAAMDFDHVVEVHADGSVTDAPASIYPPDLYHVEGQQHPRDVEGFYRPWELMHGYTGQYSYNGAVMHPSESIGGGLERDILANPGYYVALIVHGNSDDDDVYDGYAEAEPVGWAVAFRPVEA